MGRARGWDTHCLKGQERSSGSFRQRPLRPSCSKQLCPEPVLLRLAVGMINVLVTRGRLQQSHTATRNWLFLGL